MEILNVDLSVGELLGCHFLSKCLQFCFAVLSSGLYQLACLVCVLRLLVLMGETWSALVAIQVVKFVKASSRVGAGASRVEGVCP